MSVDLSVHQVSKVEIGEIRHNESGSRSYDVRDIVITHGDGQTITITLFSKDDREDLLKVAV
ncbi:hypothetical protein [Caudoviricetes sp.]|nr:hypothetical protein [Caudoviricetes sp.]